MDTIGRHSYYSRVTLLVVTAVHCFRCSLCADGRLSRLGSSMNLTRSVVVQQLSYFASSDEFGAGTLRASGRDSTCMDERHEPTDGDAGDVDTSNEGVRR